MYINDKKMTEHVFKKKIKYTQSNTQLVIIPILKFLHSL